MDTKNLSPAYFTSLAVLLLGALIIGLGTSFVAALGWVLFLVGCGLNLFSTLVVIQKAKGGPLPEMIARADSSTRSDAVHGGTHLEEKEESKPSPRHAAEPDPDTESQPLIEEAAPENEPIFKRSRPRVRNR